MSISVVEKKANGEPATYIAGGRGIVCFRSDIVEKNKFGHAIEELQSGETQKLAALEAGRRGLMAASCDPIRTSAYPVDADGNPFDNPFLPNQPIDHYQIDVVVNEGRR